MKILTRTLVVCALFVQLAEAKIETPAREATLLGTTKATVQPHVQSKAQTKEDKKIEQLIDIAGRQRMLSQRMVKDYLYKGKGVAVSKAEKELASSMNEFDKTLKTLNNSLNDPEIKNLLAFVDLSFGDFKDLTKKPFNLDNAQIALDLSESLLEGSQYVVDSIAKSNKMVPDRLQAKIVAKSGKQRMLAQRIAKYYIAYQSGIKDKNTVDQMKATVKEFSENHKDLMNNTQNSATINQKLNEVDRLWKIVYKFYLGIEKGGLPFIVFKSTNDITRKMDEITKLYVTQ